MWLINRNTKVIVCWGRSLTTQWQFSWYFYPEFQSINFQASLLKFSKIAALYSHQQQDAVAGDHCRNDDEHHEPVHPSVQLSEALPDNGTMEGRLTLWITSATKKKRKPEKILGFCASFNVPCAPPPHPTTHQFTSSWSLKVTRQMYIQHRESRETRLTSENQQHACYSEKSRENVNNIHFLVYV